MDSNRKIHTYDERENAIQELALRNMRFVISVAKKYEGLGVSLEDLICEGHFGNLIAARRFDPTKGFKFISYAVFWIRQSIMDSLNKNGRTIRIPQNKIQESLEIKNIISELTQTLEREPTYSEIADKLDLNTSTVALCLDSNRKITQLDTPFTSDDPNASTLRDIIKNESCENADKGLEDESLRTDLERTFRILTPRDADIIKLSFGLNTSEYGSKRDGSMTLEDIGKRFNLSRERVRQIRDKAIKRLGAGDCAELLKHYAA